MRRTADIAAISLGYVMLADREARIMATQEQLNAIVEAAREGNADEVVRLLDAQPDLLEAKGIDNDLLILLEAAKHGHVDLVRILLGKGANVNNRIRDGWTPLLVAVAEGHSEVVILLLEAGAGTSRMSDPDTWSALMTAAWGGQLGVSRLLLKHMRGEGVDAQDAAGWTALWIASFRGHAEICRALLLAGADPMANYHRRTPRQMARTGHGNPAVAMFQWWDGELERPYILHRARRVHEDCTTRQQARGRPVPAYLRSVERKNRWPRVHVQGDGGGQTMRGPAERNDEGTGLEEEEERHAMLNYVIQDLASELYTELLVGFHK